MSSSINKFSLAMFVLFGFVIALALGSGVNTVTSASTQGLVFESFPLDKSVRCTTNRDCQGGEVCISGRCAILAGQLPSNSGSGGSGTGASVGVSAGGASAGASAGTGGSGASANFGISAAPSNVILHGLIGLMALTPLALRM